MTLSRSSSSGSSEAVSQVTDSQQSVEPRLPCRGCMTSCQYYDICEGKPWRLDFQDKAEAKLEQGS